MEGRDAIGRPAVRLYHRAPGTQQLVCLNDLLVQKQFAAYTDQSGVRVVSINYTVQLSMKALYKATNWMREQSTLYSSQSGERMHVFNNVLSRLLLKM